MARGVAHPPHVHQVFGAECEHIIPYFLLLNMVGINHPTWAGIKDKWWKKNAHKVQASSGGQYGKGSFEAQCAVLWEYTYLWSCQPCNRYKDCAPFIDVGIATGVHGANDSSHRFVIGERKYDEGLDDAKSKDGILVGNLEQHITGLLIGTPSNCATWRGIYRGDVKAECLTFDESLISTFQKSKIASGDHDAPGPSHAYLGTDDLNGTWVR
jgi:hypothetical protein